MHTRRTVLACLFAVVVVTGGVVGTVGAGSSALSTTQTSATTITECTAIDEEGEYVLGNDLVATGDEACLVINTTGTVSIDGAGYSITGGIDGEGPDDDPSVDPETRELDLNLRDLTVDLVVYPFGGLVGDGASGTLENVTAERLDVGSATGWTVESSRIESGISGLYAGGVTFRNSTFGGTVSFDENAGRFTVVGNTFDGDLQFPEELGDSLIAENTFRGSLLLSAVGQPPQNVTVADNDFTVAAGDVAGRESGAIVLVDGRDNVIRDNRITVEGSTGNGVEGSNGMYVESTLTEIRDNTVTGADNGVRLFRASSTRLVGNTLDGNDVGVRVQGNTRLTDNRFTDNRVGVLVEGGDPVTLRENLISGNDDFGVQNLASTVVDARNNDWGATDGPSSAPASDSDAPFADPVTGALANGSGDAVSEGDTPGVSNVRFDPFLTDGEGPPLDPEIVYYQVDFAVGGPIERFGPADSDRFYSDQGRLVRFLHGSTDDPVDRTGAPSTLRDGLAACLDVESFGVEDGTATVRFTVANGDDCQFPVTLAVYEKPGSEWSRESASEQRLFGLDEAVVLEPGTYELTVEVPTTEDTTESENASATDARSVRFVTTTH